MGTLINYFGEYTAIEASKLAGFQSEYLTTFGFTALAIFSGHFLVSKSRALQRYAISTPVVSGLIFSLVISGIEGADIMEFTFDVKIMKDLCQSLSFLCVGYGFNAKMLENAGGELCIMIAFAARLLATLQNILGTVLARAIDMNSLLASQCSSTSVSGGVGTASAFGPVFGKVGTVDVTAVGAAAGMLGNTMSPLVGDPVAAYLITSKGLKSDPNDKPEAQRIGEKPILDNTCMIYVFATCLPLAVLGIPIYILLDSTLIIEMPKFTGCLLMDAIGRDMMEALDADTKIPGTEAIEHVFLELYLALVLMTIDITKLVSAAGQMGIILIAQAIMMAIFVIFVFFNLFDKGHGAAVMVAGSCGWGCGSGPNAVTNEKAVMGQYGYHDITRVLYPSSAVTIDDIYNPICLSLVGGLFDK